MMEVNAILLVNLKRVKLNIQSIKMIKAMEEIIYYQKSILLQQNKESDLKSRRNLINFSLQAQMGKGLINRDW